MTLGAANRVCAVLPVKDLVNAKQRLSPVLDGKERYELFTAMLEDVLSTLEQVEGLSQLVVVTRDTEVRSLSVRFGADILLEPANLGQTEAVNFAVSNLIQTGTTSVLIVPADIPLVRPAELEDLLRAHGCAPAVTIAPARDELGSNAMLCSPADALELRFGDNSFYPHLERARQAGIEPTIVKRPGLGLDVDVPDDLVELCRRPSETKTSEYLRKSGITERLRHDTAAFSEGGSGGI